VLTFDGTNDALATSSAWPLIGDIATTVFVVHARALATSGFPLSWGTRAGGNVGVTDDSVARVPVGLGGNATAFSNPSAAVNTPQLFSMTRPTKPAYSSNYVSFTAVVYRNGAVNNVSANTPTTNTAAGPLNIGLAVSGPSYHNGIVCEALVYSRVLTDIEHRNVCLWLGVRWGLTIT
jgi:hypothetical protein